MSRAVRSLPKTKKSGVGYPIGEDEAITDKAEVLMFYAARVQLVERYQNPRWRGIWVIGDRHDLDPGVSGVAH